MTYAIPPTPRPAASERDAAFARLQRWREDPVLFVQENFQVDPDKWQVDVLHSLPTDPRIAMSACKGPGKSAVLSWGGWWILANHYDSRGYALSITGDNLRDNLWTELAIWRDKSPYLTEMFSWDRGRIACKARPDTWWLSARSYAQSADANQQANALAGLHGKVVFILLDEIGDMPPGVVSAAKGIFYVQGQKGWVLAAGNPTTRDGALYWVTTTDVKLWKIVNISGDPDDPMRSPRIDIEMARREIEAQGRDNPWVMVNILGLFPPSGEKQLIPDTHIEEAMSRVVPIGTELTDAIVWGLDPARSERSGADEAALAKRQGPWVKSIDTWRGKTGTELGDIIARDLDLALETEDFPDAVIIDVGGVGASPYDHLCHLGWEELLIPVDFGGKAEDSEKYFDRRTEMWQRMAEYLDPGKGKAVLPKDPVLRAELRAPRYEFRKTQDRTRFKLESKDEMKRRGVASPNRADAVAVTFATAVAPVRRRSPSRQRRKTRHDYEPQWN